MSTHILRSMVILSMAIVGVADAQDAPTRATFTKDIAPILYSHCVQCHRPGEVAPMSLMTYDEVRPWVKSIRNKVLVERSMPPWHADPAHGTFSNDRRLSETELGLIDSWIRAGAPKGKADDLPEPPAFTDGWLLGEPDYIVVLPKVSLPAEGPDQFENLAVKLNFDEDKWIRAIELQPGDKRAVHHTFAYVSPDGETVGGKIGSYSIGGGPRIFTEGAGRRIAKGESLVASAHYHPFGEAITDQMRIGLYWAEGTITRESIALAVLNTKFTIPAGAKNYEVSASHTFDQDGYLTTIGPHMHRRGTDMKVSATFPDGRSETLLLTHWDPSWNIKYELAKPLPIPKGTRLDLVAHFDNSADNPNNPDPTIDLTFGKEEMMIGFIDYLVDIDPVDPSR